MAHAGSVSYAQRVRMTASHKSFHRPHLRGDLCVKNPQQTFLGGGGIGETYLLPSSFFLP